MTYEAIELKGLNKIPHPQYVGYDRMESIEDAVKMFEKKTGRKLDGFVYYVPYTSKIGRDTVKYYKVGIYDDRYFESLKIEKGITDDE